MWDAAGFGLSVQKARKIQGMTQEQLGERLGVTAQAVSKWENGDSSPDLALLPELCTALETSADALLGTMQRQGVDALIRGLRERLDGMKGEERTRARSGVLAHLLLRDGGELQGNVIDVAYHQEREGRNRLESVSLIRQDGSVVSVRSDGLPEAGDSDATIAAALAVLGEPMLLGLLRRLVGDRAQGAVVRAEARSDPAVREACDRLIEAGLLSLDQGGYQLNPTGAVLSATVLMVANTLGLGCTHGPRLFSASQFQAHDR